MARPRLIPAMIPIALCLFAGCVPTQQPVDTGAAAVTVSRAVDAGAATKVGVVNMLTVIRESTIGRPALATWERRVQEVTVQLNAEWQKLQELDQQRASGKALAEQEYQAQSQRYATVYQRYKKASFDGYLKAVAHILPKVESVTKTIAEEHDFGIVLAKGNPDTVMITFYTADTIDLTDQVIAELNRRFP